MTDLLPDIQGRNILIAPLCWGLGHAARCIPLIKHLSHHNHVEIASDGLALEWLRNELPDHDFHELPSYDIKYTDKPTFFRNLDHLSSSYTAIQAEHQATKKILQNHPIDLIISDHRLGVRSDEIESVILAHQLTIPFDSNLAKKSASEIQARLISRFDQCWVPDYPEEEKQLSGTLSHQGLSIPKTYIGPLSRFESTLQGDYQTDQYILVILSGVEPDRTQLERKLYDILSDQNQYRITLVRGTSAPRPSYMKTLGSHFKVLDLASSDELEGLLGSASLVISRCGYSTIMDLHMLKKKAIYIPSQYQPEQLYLGQLADLKIDSSCLQEHDLSAQSLFTEVKKHLGPSK